MSAPPPANDLPTPTNIAYNEGVGSSNESLLWIQFENVYLSDNRVTGYNIYIDGTKVATFDIHPTNSAINQSILWDSYIVGSHSLIVTSIDGIGGESIPSSPVNVEKVASTP